MSESIILSVVVPLHDEEEGLPEFGRRLASVLEGLDETWEVILVDDGSRDATYATSLVLHAHDPRFKVIRLSKTRRPSSAETESRFPRTDRMRGGHPTATTARRTSRRSATDARGRSDRL